MADPYVSLASSTATAIESASKHNIQCRVSTDYMVRWVADSTTTGESAQTLIRKDKMNYCVHKNDIVVGLRQGWYDEAGRMNNAYPVVVSTYANMCVAATYWLTRLYNNAKCMKDIQFLVNDPLRHRGDGVNAYNPNAGGHPGRADFQHGHNSGTSALLKHEKQQIDDMPQFYFQGVSLGMAYAHPESGDTMATVMYGGLRTVLNGHVAANTGQPVMWYFGFEAGCFDTKGRRIFTGGELTDVIEDGLAKLQGGRDNTLTDMTMHTLDRKKWHERENGNFPGHTGKTNIFYIKPYVRNEDAPENILDRERIFGIYLSSCRAFEQGDIKLQRQSA